MQEFSRKMRNGDVLIRSGLKDVEGLVMGISLEYFKEIKKEFPRLRKELIKSIRAIIKQGGDSSNISWSWSYWERRRGQRNFRLKQGGHKNFDTGWQYGSKSILRYPVHPRTYINLRNKRTQPKQSELALIDTSRYLNSFSSSTTKGSNNIQMDLVTSKYEYFKDMENGFRVKEGIIKRPHLAPAIAQFNIKNKDLMKKIGDNLAKRINRRIEKVKV